jgi:glycerol uptake facilitator-like aquaporin
MLKFAIACGTILFAILCGTSFTYNHLPPNVTIGLTLFAVCLAGVLALAARLAFVDRTRG